MPFIHTEGYPPTSDAGLLDLRERIVNAVVTQMKAPQGWVRAFFPKDALEKYQPTNCTTIWVNVDTAMFSEQLKKGMPKEELNAFVQTVLQEITNVIWDFYEGQYEVEIAVNSLNKEWMFLKMPK